MTTAGAGIPRVYQQSPSFDRRRAAARRRRSTSGARGGRPPRATALGWRACAGPCSSTSTTPSDHRQCSRLALAELYGAHQGFQVRPFDEFAGVHARLLEELHGRVLTGEVRLEEAREERFRRLFEAAGMPADGALVSRAAAAYRDGYRRVRQPVAGAAQLLALVRAHARVGIVSNNLLEEQQDKLRHCGLEPYRRCAGRVRRGRPVEARPGSRHCARAARLCRGGRGDGGRLLGRRRPRGAGRRDSRGVVQSARHAASQSGRHCD